MPTPTNPTIEADKSESKKEARLNLRVTPRQDHLIRRAAAALDKSVTEFVLDSISLEAERVLAEQRWFILSESEWTLFHEMLEQPIPTDDLRLRELLTVRREIDLSDL
ncbi:MAG: DUF1778 domain-containing protein [Actinomycetota bacterium]|nr:DUF1778 domain-containing protein [Actinomycetota bacterium]